MSTPNPVLVAAAPSLIAVLQAFQTFITNLGTDPVQVPLKLPGAAQVFLGTLDLQAPALAAAELGALQTAVNSAVSAKIANLQAIAAKPAA